MNRNFIKQGLIDLGFSELDADGIAVFIAHVELSVTTVDITTRLSTVRHLYSTVIKYLETMSQDVKKDEHLRKKLDQLFNTATQHHVQVFHNVRSFVIVSVII